MEEENSGYVSPPPSTNDKGKREKARPKRCIDSSSSSSDEELRLTKKRRLELEEMVTQEEMRIIEDHRASTTRRANKDAAISGSTIFKYWSRDMDASDYYEKRLRTLDADCKAAAGKKLYRRDFPVIMAIRDFLDKYASLKDGEHMESDTVNLAGRVMNKLSSSELITYDLVGVGGQTKVIAFLKSSSMDADTFFKFHSDLNNGDYIGVIGFPGKSSWGELSVIPKEIVNLSYCLHKMPPVDYKLKMTDDWTPGSVRYPDAYILKDQETRYRRRFLDLIMNSEIKDIFKTRTKVVSYIRHFLENHGFLEVETPTLTMFPPGGGAKRGAFVTHHDELNMKMFMRNGSENVHLKQLVVGGIERVFEIGKQFRNNEGGVNDMMHNPEITTCEFYMAHASYNDLMELTENILSGMVKDVTGGYKVMYHANGYDNLAVEIDFTPPFRRICLIEELEKIANLSIPKDLGSEEARRYLADACSQFDISCSSSQTTAQLLNKLVGHFLEVTCVNPTFIVDHPEITSPLAKAHEDKQGLTERFILFVNKLELVNGYTVENNPVVQRQRFSDQLESGNETHRMTLDYGIPPTAGLVLGIDWLTMLLTDSLNIKEVVLFPALRPPPVKVGDTIPDGTLAYLDEQDQLQTVSVHSLAAGKKVVLFGVLGAFTPTCSMKHVPGFIEKSEELKSKGVEELVLISVNDPFVMKAWKKLYPDTKNVKFLADGSACYIHALGLEFDLNEKGLGIRSRFALLVDNLKVTVANVESGGGDLTVSSADEILSAL